MLKKICKCGKKVEVNKRYCDECEANYTPRKRSKEHREFYSGGRWTKLSKAVRNKYLIDLYLFELTGIMKRAEMVHHIIPVKDNPAKAYELENLIPLTHHSHQEIEQIYALGGRFKKEMQEKLKEIIRKNNKD